MDDVLDLIQDAGESMFVYDPTTVTHSISGAILGVGSATRPDAVRWGVFADIVLAWLLTIPCSASMAALAW